MHTISGLIWKWQPNYLEPRKNCIFGNNIWYLLEGKVCSISLKTLDFHNNRLNHFKTPDKACCCRNHIEASKKSKVKKTEFLGWNVVVLIWFFCNSIIMCRYKQQIVFIIRWQGKSYWVNMKKMIRISHFCCFCLPILPWKSIIFTFDLSTLSYENGIRTRDFGLCDSKDIYIWHLFCNRCIWELQRQTKLNEEREGRKGKYPLNSPVSHFAYRKHSSAKSSR